MSGRILVVDDSRVIRQLIKVNLELEGFEVMTAADGVECLDAVRHSGADAITLDVAMPRLDGLRTAERLRSDPRTQHIPLAFISACGEVEGEDRAARGLVDAYLEKPFEPAELVQLVGALLWPEHAAEPGGPDDSGVSSVTEPGEDGVDPAVRPVR